MPAMNALAPQNDTPEHAILCTQGLTKRYGSFTALSDCTMQVGRGEVFGLLGPNGAGKTTLIRLLMGFLFPTTGTASIAGMDCHHQSVAVRGQVAYLPAEARVPRHLRGRGVLEFFSTVHPAGSMARSLELAERLELDLTRRVAFMSTGMRQKLAICVVMALRTPLVILDEPTANLDPTIRQQVLDLVVEARAEGRSVMFSSHVLSEIEDVCDRVVFLRRGALVREQAIDQLRQRHRIIAFANQGIPDLPTALAASVQVTTRGDGHVEYDVAEQLAALLSWLTSQSLEQLRVEPLGLRAIYESVHRGGSV
jgi:ABC-2 type transport system ATP-binding protein